MNLIWLVIFVSFLNFINSTSLRDDPARAGVAEHIFDERFCQCKPLFSQYRVFNGSGVPENELPWVALLYAEKDNEKFKEIGYSMSRPSDAGLFRVTICTGTIINPGTVITSAHCAKKIESAKKLQYKCLIAAGLDHDPQKIMFSKGNQVEVEDYVLHPDFEKRNETYNPDIALIKTKQAFVFGDETGIAPACLLLQKEEEKFPIDFIAAGYGRQQRFITPDTEESAEDFQRELQLPLSNLSMVTVEQMMQCFSRTICAQSIHGSVCPGDSGGPLHYLHNNKLYVVGSYILGAYTDKDNEVIVFCGQRVKGAWVRIYDEMDFIKKHSGGFC